MTWNAWSISSSTESGSGWRRNISLSAFTRNGLRRRRDGGSGVSFCGSTYSTAAHDGRNPLPNVPRPADAHRLARTEGLVLMSAALEAVGTQFDSTGSSEAGAT